jgi:molecular chaperone DnaK (HSP70)
MTKPLTGYEKEIAILHAEARLDAELIEDFKGEAHEYKQAIERVRELAEKFEQEPQDEMVNYHLVARRIFTAIKDCDK